ncbi:MAG: HAD family phosphatase [Planctomycetota bacterium]
MPTAIPADRVRQQDLSESYTGIVFDCDGTLTNSMPIHYEAWRATLSVYGIHFDRERFFNLGGMPGKKIIALLSGETGKPVDTPAALEQKEKEFLNRMDDLRTIDWVCEIARSHHGKIPMAVASGGVRSVINAQLERLKIACWFDTVVTSEDTTEHKPEPEPFLLAAKKLNVDASQCVVFEDSPLGFTAAEKAGMYWVDVR